MTRKDIIFEIDSQLLDKNEVTISKEIGKEIIDILKNYDKMINERLKMLKEIKNKYHIIDETKANHLILADNTEYHRHRYLVEREKIELLDEIIELFYEK